MAAMLALLLVCASLCLSRGSLHRLVRPSLHRLLGGAAPETAASNSTVTSADNGTALKAVDYHLPEGLGPEAAAMAQRYGGKVVFCRIPQFPQCTIVLCGTVHVAGYSSIMVKVSSSRPSSCSYLPTDAPTLTLTLRCAVGRHRFHAPILRRAGAVRDAR